MSKDVTILVDFDYTLFDTTRFVNTLSSSPKTVDYKDFLYPDALGFLEYASEFGNLILFSEGEIEFQKEKIDGVDIEKLFSGGIKILPSYTKVSELTKMSNAVNLIMIDDKPDVVDQAVSLGFKTIRINRGKYAGVNTKLKPNFVVESLEEIVKKDLLRDF